MHGLDLHGMCQYRLYRWYGNNLSEETSPRKAHGLFFFWGCRHATGQVWYSTSHVQSRVMSLAATEKVRTEVTIDFFARSNSVHSRTHYCMKTG